MSEPDDGAVSQHVLQSVPYEWEVVKSDGNRLVVWDAPERLAECYVVSGMSKNVRSLVQADAVLYDGQLLHPYYDKEIACVEFSHSFAGIVDRQPVEGILEEPAVRLSKLSPMNPREVFSNRE